MTLESPCLPSHHTPASRRNDFQVEAMDPAGVPPSIARVTGPLLLGFLFNYGLFGVLSVQVYTFHEYFPNEQWRLKSLVYGLYIVEAVQTVMITSDAFEKFVYGFGNFSGLDQLNLLWFDVVIMDGVVAFSVQLYFAYRLFLLSRSKILVAFIAIMALAQLSGALATGILAQIGGSFSSLKDRAFIAAMFWFGGGVACDVVIAVAMTWAVSLFPLFNTCRKFLTTQIDIKLLKYRRRFQESGDLVGRLIRLTMETGSLTATVALIDLIVYFAFPNDPFHTTPALALAKLYSNSLMVVLNSRPGARSHQHANETITGVESRRSSAVHCEESFIYLALTTPYALFQAHPNTAVVSHSGPGAQL
ncbi:hypothetical protein V5O48_010927 [Marasmius crinis-equi]|uniref:DUF6534 domain-containing protein n=1 Tax=Marasmius crinis-equi TaxID=585013 RepID=A0ABR3F727_9AGAR